MKNIITYLIIICTLVIFNSCSDYLEEEITAGITAETHFTTAAGLEDGVKAAYEELRSFYGREEGGTMTVFGTDEYEKKSGSYGRFGDYTSGMSASSNVLEVIWDSFYQGINTCNAVIYFAEDIPEFSQARLGEVRFLRAFYYWMLVEQFGDVHFTLEYTQGVETEANRTSEETIYNEVILPDLEYAVANLPAEASDYGRINKGIAEAFYAKVQLTLGWKKEIYSYSGSNAENWQKALTLSQNVINNYTYELLDNFEDVFDFFNQENSEVVWPIQYGMDPLLNDEGNKFHLYFLGSYDRLPGMKRDLENGRPWRRFKPSRWMLTLYDEDMDSRYTGTFRSVWYCNNLSNAPEGMQLGDTAVYTPNYAMDDSLQATLLYTVVDMEPRDYEGEFRTQDWLHFPANQKFHDAYRPGGSGTTVGTRDFFAIRLAELYLIGAEAAMMMGDNEKAADLINVVRRRAAFEGKESDMEISASDVDLDFILDERSRELTGEQMRWLDLKRVGKLIERYSLYNLSNYPDPPAIKDYHIYRPIPLTMFERISNPEDFPQNEGYAF
jgi:starch-binding outer membrane protein, SusD/RagB family